MSKHGFKHTRSFEFCLYGQATLSQIRRSLKRIGKQIDRLRFSSEKGSHRYFEILGRYVGNNVRYFCLDVVDLKECSITAIKPIFENLTSLDIANSYYKIVDFALFQTLCPNLIKLKLHFGGIQRLFWHNKPWPKLRNLTIKSNQCNADELSEFLEQNPQITTFKLRQSRSLKQIARYLPNVQRITIDSQHCKPDDITSSLITLKNLTKLSLKPLTNNSYWIIDCLRELVSLRELKIIAEYTGGSTEKTATIQKSIKALVQLLPNLEIFCLSGMCLVEETVLHVISFARNLKIIHIHRLDFKITPEFILEMVEQLKLSRQENDIAPLKLFIDEKDTTDFKAIHGLDIKHYLRVDVNCGSCHTWWW